MSGCTDKSIIIMGLLTFLLVGFQFGYLYGIGRRK